MASNAFEIFYLHKPNVGFLLSGCVVFLKIKKVIKKLKYFHIICGMILTCRKKKAVHKTTTTDDKRLQTTLKRLGVHTITQIEEVNIFKDETVIQFSNPKVQGNINSNMWVVSGSPQTKNLEDILPGIINQLGPDDLRKLAEQFQKQTPGATTTQVDDDDQVPELVPGETFEAAAEEGPKP